MTTSTIRRASIIAVAIAVALTSFSAPTLAGQKKLYGGCATKSELFRVVKNYGAKPKSIRGEAKGVVVVRGKDKQGVIWDYLIPPCLLMVDGRILVDGKGKVEEQKT